MTFDEFTFEESPWELTLQTLKKGDKLSAARFLTLLEGETEETLEDAFHDLLSGGISLDISDLPVSFGTGELAARLRREQQLVAAGTLLHALEETDPLRLYLQELASTPSFGDPVILAQAAVEGDTAARGQLLNAMLHRVVDIAKEYTGKGVLLLDLMQEGSLGLWEGLLSWQGQAEIESYCDWWIRQSMAKTVTLQAAQNGVGQKLRQALEDYRAADEKLLLELGRNPTLEEIAESIHATAEETALVAGMLERISTLNRVTAEPEPQEEEEGQAVEDTAYFQTRQRISELLSGLSEQEAKLLILRFGLEGGLPMSPEDTGKRLGLTPEEVVAMEAAALQKLRN